MPVRVLKSGPMICAKCGVRGRKGFTGQGADVYCPAHAHLARKLDIPQGRVGVTPRNQANARWNMGDGPPDEVEGSY